MTAARHRDLVNPHRSGYMGTIEIGDTASVYFEDGGADGYPAVGIDGGNLNFALVPRSLLLNLHVTDCDVQRWRELATAAAAVADELAVRLTAQRAAADGSGGTPPTTAEEVNNVTDQTGTDAAEIEAQDTSSAEEPDTTDQEEQEQASDR